MCASEVGSCVCALRKRMKTLPARQKKTRTHTRTSKDLAGQRVWKEPKKKNGRALPLNVFFLLAPPSCEVRSRVVQLKHKIFI